MRTKIRGPKRRYAMDEWRPYFVWFPRKIDVAPSLTPDKYYPCYVWVWLETVEHRNVDPGPTYIHWRLPPKPEEQHREIPSI